jgi:hypothetical protein
MRAWSILLALSSRPHPHHPLSKSFQFSPTISHSRRTTATTNLIARTMTSKNLVVDPFCFRQFAEHEASQNYGGAVL